MQVESLVTFLVMCGVTDNKGNISLEMNDMSIQFRIPYYLAKCLANAGKGIIDLEGTEEGITFLD
jgi:hypothetical protein